MLVIGNALSITIDNLLPLIWILVYPHGMKIQRQTRQLQAIRDAFEAAGRPMSIDELHALATGEIDSLGLRTVYRAVRRLQEAGEIVSVPVPGNTDRYELASAASTHHHHFHCTACDRYFDVHGCPGGLKKLLPKGFKLEHHDLTLSGLCASCA